MIAPNLLTGTSWKTRFAVAAGGTALYFGIAAWTDRPRETLTVSCEGSPSEVFHHASAYRHRYGSELTVTERDPASGKVLQKRAFDKNKCVAR
jgi:hypothetical protein